MGQHFLISPSFCELRVRNSSRSYMAADAGFKLLMQVAFVCVCVCVCLCSVVCGVCGVCV